MKKIAIIGADKSRLHYYKQVKALGYYIVGIAWEEGAVCRELCDVFYPISFKDKEAVLTACQKEQIDGITSFALETALPTVIYVSQKMGLVSNTEECVALTQTKYAQRRAFESAGLPVPAYYQIDAVEQLHQLQCRYPMVMKPVDSGGSRGIYKVNDEKQMLEAYQDVVRYSPSGKAIIEEYIDGREFSVEYISHNGRHYFLQITDKVTSGEPHFVEMQHHQPANISESLSLRIREMVEKALTALKIENSASHTEIKLNSKDELYIIEIGARMGGDRIASDLVRLSTGYDFVEGVVKLACGDFEEPIKTLNCYSGVYFYSALQPFVADYVKNKDKYPEIVDASINNLPLVPVVSNGQRNGYLLYQSQNHKFVIYE